jgi:2-dehydro-3-deoxyglucarate aldolase
MLKALETIKDCIQKRIKPFGFHVVDPDVNAAITKFRDGYSFLAFGVDFLFLGGMSRNMLGSLRESKEKTDL